MPKFPPIPRLSIVIPIGRDLAGFESTLISVLENKPADCEVLVAHDGSYDDPFDLCDEVEFVITDRRSSLVDLISPSVHRARGRFIHVIAEGVQATPGWIDSVLDEFDRHDVGLVIPVIRSGLNGKILAAGWTDGMGRLCQPAGPGKRAMDARATAQVGGAYLQASFWRRDLIRSLCNAFDAPSEAPTSSVEAAYAYAQLSRAGGWRSAVATGCDLISDSETLPWEASSLRRGQRLRAMKEHFGNAGWGRSLACAAQAMLLNVLRPATYGESFGQALAPLAVARIAQGFHQDLVALCEDPVSVKKMPMSRDIQRHAA